MTDLSKAFHCIDQELLVAKIHEYSFDIESLNFIDNYHAGRKQRVKIKSYLVSEVRFKDQYWCKLC